MKDRFTKRSVVEAYMRIYDSYKDKGKRILFYQMGCCYEVYGVENEKETLGNIKQVCMDIGLTLTNSNKIKSSDIKGGNNRDYPLMAGFPIHSLKKFLKKSIDRDYTVIVYSEQDVKGQKSKKRVFDGIYSPSTYIEDIDENDSVNLMCINYSEIKDKSEIISSFEIVILDMTTGKCQVFSFGGEKNETLIKLYNLIKITHIPKEIIICGDDLNLDTDIKIHKRTIDKQFEKQSYQETFLKRVFPNHGKLSVIEYLGLEKYNDCVVSLIVLINFVYEYDQKILYQMSKPKINLVMDTLKLSSKTITQLDLIDNKNSLFKIIDKTSTIGGRRLLKQRLLSPITSIKNLERRYDEISEINYEKFDDLLKGICDLERLQRKMTLKRIQPFELFTLYSSYLVIQKLLETDYPCKKHINETSISSFNKFIELVDDTFFINKLQKYNVDKIDDNIFQKIESIKSLKDKQDEAMKKLEQYAKETSKFIDTEDIYISVCNTETEGYYFKVTKKRYDNFLKKHTNFKIKTMTADVKMFDDKIKKLSDIIIETKKMIIEESKKEFLEFLNKLDSFNISLKNIANYVSYVDVVKSIKKVSTLLNYTRPKIVDSEVSFLKAKDMRHPLVERICQEKFVSNDFEIGNGGVLLYGVNGVGKSVWLKALGINIILAQSGFFVPASSFEFYPYSTMITKISMNDDIYKHKSTFTCEMIDLREMLEYANENSMILADELCSGTETNSAIAIVASSIISLSKTKSSFLFTTHLHQLTKLEIKKLKNVSFKHLSITIEKGDIVYGRKIIDGSGDSSYGVDIARHLNVGDDEFIKNAIRIRRDIEGEAQVILSTKPSRYNSNKFIDKCERCGSIENVHTHHIEHQEDADENGMINGYHKNSKWNLMGLCRECHMKEHSH